VVVVSYMALFGTVLRVTEKTSEFAGSNSKNTRVVTRGSITKCGGQFICFELMVGSPIRFAMSKQIFPCRLQESVNCAENSCHCDVNQ
jgi:hypothetical protein